MCLNKWHDKLMRQSIISNEYISNISIGLFLNKPTYLTSFFNYIAIVVISSMSTIIFILSITCVYDGAGKSFHKLKVFESNYSNHPHKITDSMRHLRHR